MLIFCYPLLWALGAAVLFWPLMVVVSVPYLLRVGPTRLASASLAVAVALGLSSAVGTVMFGWQTDRLVGLAANISVWVGLAGLLTLGSRRDLARPLSRAFAVITSAQGLMILLA